MIKKEHAASAIFILMVVVTGLYAAAIFSGSLFWSSILSPADASLAGIAFIYAYLKSSGKKPALIFIFLAASCFLWALGDIILAVLQFQGKDPLRNLPDSLLYSGSNVLLAVGVLMVLNTRNSKWRTMSLAVETLTIGILSIYFIWLVIFSRGTSAVQLLTTDGVISAASILFDVYLCVKLITLFITVKKSEMPLHLILVASGLFLYAIVDLDYYVLLYEKVYHPGSYSDLLYICCHVLTATGALLFVQKQEGPITMLEPRQGAGKSKWLFFLGFPVLAVAAGSARLVDLLIFAAIILLYHVSMRNIRLAWENEALYKYQSSINEKLEKRLEDQRQEITALADHDASTMLYNRRYFADYVAQVAAGLKNGEKLAVIQFDVDRFKTINDSYGHNVGDRVIEELSKRLQEWNTAGAVLARLGGDEFAVMLTGSITRDTIGVMSRQIIDICSKPIFVGQQVLYVTVSIGISVCPDDAHDAVTLLKNSDISMYKAKAEGFNKHVFYTPLFEENITRKNEIEALLRKADLAHDFELVFQPQFSIPDERLIGAEALLRWRSAEHGYIPPSVFVPVAEEIDYIDRIGKWVLQKAVEQVAQWNKKYGLNLKMGINISPKQLLEDDFFETLMTLINANGIDTSWIDAEITENLMIKEKEKVKPIFDLFEERNISVSIDDFGSGYSSLGYINKYHFDRIKIDKSLIDNLLIPGGSGAEVVKAIVTMADAVGKTTIAEGVETVEQLEILNDIGCRQVQGYLLGRPVHADVFVARFIEKELGTDREEAGQARAVSPKPAGA